jgi:cytochrome d ubiquinol oxidase subunit II
LFSLLALVAVVAIRIGRQRRHDPLAFLGSSAVIAGLLGAAAVALYPTLLYSTLDPRHSLTAEAALSPPYGLKVALVWWPIAFALAVSYFTSVFRANRGRIVVADESRLE